MRSVLRNLVVALMGTLLLVAPFGCFAAGFTRAAADCCSKGKCVPNPDADNCCKLTVPSGSDSVAASSEGLAHLLAPADLVATYSYLLHVADSLRSSRLELAWSPPGSPPAFRLTLPLLI